MQRKLYINQIYQTGKLKVNGQIIDIERPNDAVELMTILPKRRWEYTKMITVKGMSQTDAAYALASQGKVVVIYQTPPGDYQQGIGSQTLLRPFVEEVERSKAVLSHEPPLFIDNVGIFLNSSFQYLSPRTVDIIMIHSDTLADFPDRANTIAAAIELYDFVVFDNTIDADGDPLSYETIEKAMKPGIARSIVQHLR